MIRAGAKVFLKFPPGAFRRVRKLGRSLKHEPETPREFHSFGVKFLRIGAPQPGPDPDLQGFLHALSLVSKMHPSTHAIVTSFLLQLYFQWS
jgi:hypothetical protein